MIQATVYNQGEIVYQGLVNDPEQDDQMTIMHAMHEMKLTMNEEGIEFDNIECRFIGIGANLAAWESMYYAPNCTELQAMEDAHEDIAAAR